MAAGWAEIVQFWPRPHDGAGTAACCDPLLTEHTAGALEPVSFREIQGHLHSFQVLSKGLGSESNITSPRQFNSRELLLLICFGVQFVVLDV